MRAAISLFGTVLLASCAATPGVEQVTMPLEIFRAEGEAPAMGEPELVAGGYNRADPYSLSISFDGGDETLGRIRSVSWTIKLDGYCRDRASWVQSIIVGPTGEVWRGFRVAVPAGPDRTQYWSSGSSHATGPYAVATPGLVAAIETGGRFTLAIEDDEGRRWSPSVIDTLSPVERERLFARNRQAFAAANPDVPVRQPPTYISNPLPPSAPPYPPRSCSAS